MIDNPPAFPCKYYRGPDRSHGERQPTEVNNSGMTLRDWFASNSPFTLDTVRGTHVLPNLEEEINVLARMNWAYAEAMLKERMK